MNKFKRTTVATLLSVLCGAPAFAAGGSEVYTPYHAPATTASTSSSTSSTSSTTSTTTAAAPVTSSTTGTTTPTTIQGLIWPDQSYLKYYNSSSSTTPTGPHLGHPPGGLIGSGRSGSQAGNTPELVPILCDTCATAYYYNGVYQPCNTVTNPMPPPNFLNPCNPTIGEDGAVSFFVNYLGALWVEILKPSGTASDGVYVGVRMDGGTKGVPLPLALPTASGGVGGSWSLDVIGDVASLEAVTVYHVNLVTIGTQPGADGNAGSTKNGGTYQQLALYVPAASPPAYSGATGGQDFYYTTATNGSGVQTVTQLLHNFPPKSVIDFVYLVNNATGPYALVNNGQVDGRHATVSYTTVSDCSLTQGYAGTPVPPGTPPLGNITCATTAQ